MSLSVWYTIHTVMGKTLIHSYDMSCFEDDFGKKEKMMLNEPGRQKSKR